MIVGEKKPRLKAKLPQLIMCFYVIIGKLEVQKSPMIKLTTQ